MNAQWLGDWNLGHRRPIPTTASSTCYEAQLAPADRLRVRSRLPTVPTCPTPGSRNDGSPPSTAELPKALPIRLDGAPRRRPEPDSPCGSSPTPSRSSSRCISANRPSAPRAAARPYHLQTQAIGGSDPPHQLEATDDLHPYAVEEFTPDEEDVLRRYVTNLDKPGVRARQPARGRQGRALRPVLALVEEPAPAVPRRVRRRSRHLR